MESGIPQPSDELIDGLVLGRAEAVSELTDDVYGRLRAMADRHLRSRFGQAAGHLTVQPTSLVNESLLRVIRNRQQHDVEGAFFKIINTVMKNVLLDYIRERRAQKRGGGSVRIEFNPELHAPVRPEPDDGIDVEALFIEIERLESLDPRKGDVARMRLLWGMQMEEIASSLELSLATVERDWSFAKAWLKRSLAARIDTGSP